MPCVVHTVITCRPLHRHQHCLYNAQATDGCLQTTYCQTYCNLAQNQTVGPKEDEDTLPNTWMLISMKVHASHKQASKPQMNTLQGPPATAGTATTALHPLRCARCGSRCVCWQALGGCVDIILRQGLQRRHVCAVSPGLPTARCVYDWLITTELYLYASTQLE
jgi:hypothetical protein